MKVNLTLLHGDVCVILLGAKATKINDSIVSVDFDNSKLTKEMVDKMVKLGCSIMFFETEIHVCARRKIVDKVEFV